MSSSIKIPKVLISYSWTTFDHQQWVLNFAEELVSTHRIDVILDKWSTKEGDDLYVFMESMVKDSSIDKVLMICDHRYVKKADGREGGVGTETTIISSEVYGKASQNKFIAIVVEKDEEGQPCLPIYYKSRKYVDFSNEEKYARNFEQLLRAIYNKPQFIKPKLAQHPPAFLTEDGKTVSLGTDSAFRLAKQAILGGKDNADGLISHYLEMYSDNLEKLRLKTDKDTSKFPDQVIDSINSFLPYRNQFIEIIKTIAQFRKGEIVKLRLHSFFESLISYLYPQKHFKTSHDWDYDNYKFTVEELFLSCIATLIKYERFDLVSTLVNKEYYFPIPFNSNIGKIHSFATFQKSIGTLDYKKQQESINVYNLQAHILKDRFEDSIISFADIQQADFLLFLIDAKNTAYNLVPYQKWNPFTLIYKDAYEGEFEIFIRSKSKAYFDIIKSIFNVDSKDELLTIFQGFENNILRSPQWGMGKLNPDYYVNYSELCTKQ